METQGNYLTSDFTCRLATKKFAAGAHDDGKEILFTIVGLR